MYAPLSLWLINTTNLFYSLSKYLFAKLGWILATLVVNNQSTFLIRLTTVNTWNLVLIVCILWLQRKQLFTVTFADYFKEFPECWHTTLFTLQSPQEYREVGFKFVPSRWGQPSLDTESGSFYPLCVHLFISLPVIKRYYSNIKLFHKLLLYEFLALVDPVPVITKWLQILVCSPTIRYDLGAWFNIVQNHLFKGLLVTFVIWAACNKNIFGFPVNCILNWKWIVFPCLTGYLQTPPKTQANLLPLIVPLWYFCLPN